MATDVERRFNHEIRLIQREEGNKGLPVIEGHAAVFDQETVIRSFWYDFREKFVAGAFAKDIAAKADVRALIDHMSEKVIGRTKSGTLRISEDKTGLFTSTDPSDTSDGRDIVERIRRGDVDGMSIGFYIRKQVWVVDEAQDMELREIHDVQLVDISPVTFPAYPQTDVSVRKMLNDSDREEFEAIGKLLMRVKTDRLKEGDEEEAKRLVERLQKIQKKSKVEDANDLAKRKMKMAEFELSLLALD